MVALLSDRDIRGDVDAGRIVLDPYDAAMVEPSSVDVRLDRYFRVFENHRYPHIDPAADQPDLTRAVEPDGDEPFILHPGEFVLGSTYEQVTLPDDVAARLEGSRRWAVSGCSRTRLGQARVALPEPARPHRLPLQPRLPPHAHLSGRG